MLKAKRNIILLVGHLALVAAGLWFFASPSGRSLFQRKIDLNSANFSQLDRVPYITPAMAEGIIAERPFEEVDDIVRVTGIGEVTLKRTRGYFKVVSTQ